MYISGILLIVACLGFLIIVESKAGILLVMSGFVLGLSRGVFIAPFNELTLHSVPVYMIEKVSSYNAITRYIGMGLGVMIGSTLARDGSNLSTANWSSIAMVHLRTLTTATL